MDMLPIFSTPVWQGEYQNFHEEKVKILNAVQEYKDEHPEGQTTHNIGGYESPGFLHQKTDLNGLLTYICDISGKAAVDMDMVRSKIYISSTWTDYLGVNNYIEPHTSHDIFTGIVFLQIPDNSGKFCFMNSTPSNCWDGKKLLAMKSEYTADVLKLEPIEGQVFLWPSYVSTYIEPGTNNEDLIAISFTIQLEPNPE